MRHFSCGVESCIATKDVQLGNWALKKFGSNDEEPDPETLLEAAEA